MNNMVKNAFGPAFLISSAESVQLLNNVAISANTHPQATNYVYGTATPKEAVVVYGSRDVQICGQMGSVGTFRAGPRIGSESNRKASRYRFVKSDPQLNLLA